MLFSHQPIQCSGMLLPPLLRAFLVLTKICILLQSNGLGQMEPMSVWLLVWQKSAVNSKGNLTYQPLDQRHHFLLPEAKP